MTLPPGCRCHTIGPGVGFGFGFGAALAVGAGVPVGVGVGVGDAAAEAEADGEGDGDGLGVGTCCTVVLPEPPFGTLTVTLFWYVPPSWTPCTGAPELGTSRQRQRTADPPTPAEVHRSRDTVSSAWPDCADS